MQAGTGKEIWQFSHMLLKLTILVKNLKTFQV